MNENAHYHEYVPTLSDRFWRALGYRGSYPETTAEMEALPGWIRTDVRIRLSWCDRLRLLFSGRAIVKVETATEYLPGDSTSVSAFQIERPVLREDT